MALALSILPYSYSLIMGTSDAVLPWALKILMIARVTVAGFIYRKPFLHLFSAVGYGLVGARERADAGLAQAGSLARRNTLDAATVGVPGFAASTGCGPAGQAEPGAGGLPCGLGRRGRRGRCCGGGWPRRPPRPQWAPRTAGPNRPARLPGDAATDEAQGGSGAAAG